MYKYFKKFCAYFVGSLSFMFGLKACLAVTLTPKLIIFSPIFAAVVCAAFVWIEFKSDAESRPENSPGEGEGVSISLTINRALKEVKYADAHDESIAAEASRIVRGGLDKHCITYKQYKEWRRKNPAIFTAVVDKEGRLIGFFDIFPVTEEAARGLSNGMLSEHALTIKDILPADQNASAKYIYVASIMANPRQKSYSPIIARELIMLKFAEYLAAVFPPNGKREIIAFAHTRAGERLLKNAEFTNTVLSTDNRQGDPFYKLSPEGYMNLGANIGVLRRDKGSRA